MKEGEVLITHLDVCEVVGQGNLPAFNRNRMDVLIPQTKLAAEIANDPGYQERWISICRAVINHDLEGAANAIIEKANYAREKWGKNENFNAGIEYGALCTLIQTSLAKSALTNN